MDRQGKQKLSDTDGGVVVTRGKGVTYMVTETDVTLGVGTRCSPGAGERRTAVVCVENDPTIMCHNGNSRVNPASHACSCKPAFAYPVYRRVLQLYTRDLCGFINPCHPWKFSLNTVWGCGTHVLPVSLCCVGVLPLQSVFSATRMGCSGQLGAAEDRPLCSRPWGELPASCPQCLSGTILKRWKRNWFDLWSDGHLVYYGDQTRQSMEDKVHLPVDCINLRVGLQCRDIQPPDGKPQDCMLQIVCRDGRTISVCAESPDDCLAWKFTLQDCRTNSAYLGSEVVYDSPMVAAPPPPPPPYTAYASPDPEAYGYCPYGAAAAYAPGTQVVYAADGQAYAVPCQYPYAGLYGQQPTRHVIVRERHPGSDGDLALGMLAGAATGMALGSLFWVF